MTSQNTCSLFSLNNAVVNIPDVTVVNIEPQEFMTVFRIGPDFCKKRCQIFFIKFRIKNFGKHIISIEIAFVRKIRKIDTVIKIQTFTDLLFNLFKRFFREFSGGIVFTVNIEPEWCEKMNFCQFSFFHFLTDHLQITVRKSAVIKERDLSVDPQNFI